MQRSHGTVLLTTIIAALYLGTVASTLAGDATPTEAPQGYDSLTNGYVDQARYDELRASFEERDEIADGLGPVYNAQSCAECHQTPITGGSSQVSELRVAQVNASGQYSEPPGGSLINDRAIDSRVQEIVPNAYKVRTLRMSTNVLGAGYVEAISNTTLTDIANGQPAESGGQIAGEAIKVPILESAGATRVGRFGWKNQHASLLSFSADAYLNEVGITSRLLPFENTSLGRTVAPWDTVADPEDTNNDIDAFADFMRATKAPPRDWTIGATPDGVAGSAAFGEVGCGICHREALVTSPAGTSINGGTYTVPFALGNKIIHPYSDYLLHDVGTGDGIVQNGGAQTANKLRTTPLWGLRTRSRLMHDGASLTVLEAIRRHGGEASGVISAFNALSSTRRNQMLTFLQSF